MRGLIFNSKGGGTLVEANMTVPEKEASYPENRMFGYSLPAYGLYVRHVKGLVVDNFIFRLRAQDMRPALVLDDCHEVRLSDFDLAPPSGDQSLIRLVNSKNVTISGYQSSSPVPIFLKVEGERSSGIKLTGNDFTSVKTITGRSDNAASASVKEFNNIVTKSGRN